MRWELSEARARPRLKHEPGSQRLPVTLWWRLGLWGPSEGGRSSSLRSTQPLLGWGPRTPPGWKNFSPGRVLLILQGLPAFPGPRASSAPRGAWTPSRDRTHSPHTSTRNGKPGIASSQKSQVPDQKAGTHCTASAWPGSAAGGWKGGARGHREGEGGWPLTLTHPHEVV